MHVPCGLQHWDAECRTHIKFGQNLTKVTPQPSVSRFNVFKL